jgi:serine/threonine-protein kinase HipA
MKFSGNLKDDKLAIPARGIGGHWILKLPSPAYPHVIELEYSMLTLARAMGIGVPDFRLISTRDIENMPPDVPESLQGNALISRRFDRTDKGGRIHMEDFAQICAVRDKYDESFNYQSIANVIWQEAGLDATVEYVRRLVHMVLTGNADMHLKNWSLTYPDGVHANLSPAYDFVSTIVYSDLDKRLPHKIAAVNDFTKVELETFKDFAKIAGLPQRPVANTVLESVASLKEQWLKVKHDLPLPSSFVRDIDEHMSTVPLANQRRH